MKQIGLTGLFSFLSLIVWGAEILPYNKVSEMNPLAPLSIIYIDEATELKLGLFPIDRRFYADLLRQIAPGKPRAVVLKFFFTDPRPSDSILIPNLSQSFPVFTQAGGVLQPESYSTDQLAPFSLGPNSWSFPDFKYVWTPTKELAQAFSGVGCVNVDSLKDNRFHGFFLISSLRGTLYPSLPLLMLSRELKAQPVVSRGHVDVGTISIPINDEGAFTIDLSKPGSLYPTYSFIDVLSGKIDPANFTNNIVIVFTTDKSVPQEKSDYETAHNFAEIVADSINSAYKLIK